MSIAIKRSVVAEGREICYCLERKDVKNLNLRVRKNGSVFVSANNRIPLEEIDKFTENGATYLQPQGNATRAQVAAILMRFIENLATNR